MPRTGGERRKTTIVEEAIRQFGTEGYAGATLDSIAQSVGVRKQTILYYFPNKDALLEACLAAAGQRVAEEISAALEASPDAEQRAEAVIHAVYAVLMHLADASEEYELARTAGPDFQTPLVALSRVEQVLGHDGRARALAFAGLRLEKTAADDPWWDHRIGFDRESLYWLRDEVRRPQ